MPDSNLLTNHDGPLSYTDSFTNRHLGPSEVERAEMLRTVGFSNLNTFVDSVVPSHIRLKGDLDIGPGLTEFEALRDLRKLASQNQVWRSYLGMGYHGTIIPGVIQRNILENPGWYTQYTPYQAEIAQGRLEALLNFQTMVIDFTGLPVANASLLDEGTAAAEAMAMSFALKNRDSSRPFFVSELCHPQTISIVETRAEPLGVQVIVGDHHKIPANAFGALVQYPGTDGRIFDYTGVASKLHAQDGLLVVAADILSLALLKSPGEMGADIAVGTTQRFGVPIGYGGPHAAYLAAKDEHKRLLPGRIIGVSKDAQGKPAARLALQTREQHIRREKATSNICTAQVLLAVMAGMYAVYHGPEGIKRIASRVKLLTDTLALGLQKLGYTVPEEPIFDTVRVGVSSSAIAKEIQAAAKTKKINLRSLDEKTLCVSLDETVSSQDLRDLLEVFGRGKSVGTSIDDLAETAKREYGVDVRRTSKVLTHKVFNTYHSETEMLRYIRKLESRDLSLTHSMIALGSCTMKLNASAEMFPVSWPEFSAIHPYVPLDQAQGYQGVVKGLERWLGEITGFAGISLQPNAGSQGEYAGLLVIRKYHQARKQAHRNICLIPKSAHGTNPASAVMAGMDVVVVECDTNGNVDLSDLRKKAAEYKDRLSAAMITYPSTHGVFEAGISDFCKVVHDNGGQVYMDGANMNAQVGLCRPGDFGPDVCHLNLHKTFCIPHGGGGPGMGPIGVRQHLVEFLPTHPVVPTGGKNAIGPISAAPWGSSSILLISWMYIAMMGTKGLRSATETAILNANYMAKKLDAHFPVLYKGTSGLVAHECIVDLRKFKQTSGIEVEDVAKRLMDFGFHAPTVSFPVAGTMMIEPTESESKAEMDRFIDAMITIRKEIGEVEAGMMDRENNVLKLAPHTAEVVTADKWDRSYSREKAAFPLKWVRERKFWPAVARINAVLGDRNLICACPSIEEYS